MIRKVIAILSVIVILSTLFCACRNEDTQYNFVKISAAEAKEMLDKGGYVLIDVRKQEEYDEKHIPGCILVTIDKEDVEAFKEAIVKAAPDKNAKTIVYCKAGFRSEIAAKAMCTLGYTDVYDLTEGMDGWTYEVE